MINISCQCLFVAVWQTDPSYIQQIRTADLRYISLWKSTRGGTRETQADVFFFSQNVRLKRLKLHSALQREQIYELTMQLV